jgi:hypothetical protein
MGKLTDLVNRGVRLIVTDDSPVEDEVPPEREIPPNSFKTPPPTPSVRSEVPADVADFAAVYKEAAIVLPPHGYGVDKVSEMLAGKRLAPLGRDVKATAVLAALEAAGVPIRDVIEDGVRRDRALDAFEAAKEREVQELGSKSGARIKELQEEMEAFLKEKRAEIEDLKRASEAAEQAFKELQERKAREEERLHEVISYFLEGSDNPITASRRSTPPAPENPKKSL